MSLVHSANQTTDLKQRDHAFIRDYGFILALICMVLALLGCQRDFHASTGRKWNHERAYHRRALTDPTHYL
jgi:hypothetical protein